MVEALKGALTDGNLPVYPEYGAFKQKLAGFLELTPQEVCISNGSDGIIKLVIDTFVEKGREVIIPVPTYSMFKFYASVADARITEVLYEKELAFPAKAVRDAIGQQTALVVLVNPNSPTGTPIAEVDIRSIVKKAAETDALVLLDEAYWQFSGQTSRSLVREFDNLAVIQTFSKAFGLAGLRLGYLVSNPRNVAALDKANSPYGVSTLALIGGSAALDDLDFVEAYAREVRENRSKLSEKLASFGLKVYPSEGNFLLVDFGSNERCADVCRKLREKDILIRNRSSEPLLEGCARMNVGTAEQCERVLRELDIILRPQALLYDMDGVLVDVSRSYRKVIAKTAEYFTKKGVSERDVQEIKQIGGYNNDWDATEALIVKQGVKVEKSKIIAKFQEYYLGKGEKPGMIENERWMLARKKLEMLASRYALGIVTGRPRAEAEYALKAAGCEGIFEVIVAMEDCPEGKSKPDPYGIQLALRKMGRTQGIYVGDSGDDMKAAKAAGITGIGVIPAGITSAAGIKEKLQQMGAETVLDSIGDLERVIS